MTRDIQQLTTWNWQLATFTIETQVKVLALVEATNSEINKQYNELGIVHDECVNNLTTMTVRGFITLQTYTWELDARTKLIGLLSHLTSSNLITSKGISELQKYCYPPRYSRVYSLYINLKLVPSLPKCLVILIYI